MERSNDARLVTLALVALVVYNLFFFWGKFALDFLPGFIVPVFTGLKETVGFLTILEILGVASVFVDVVGRYEKLQEQNPALLRLRIVLIALLLVGFFFKLFVNYLDSALA